MTLEEIKNMEVFEFETSTEVNSIESFIHSNNLENSVRAFKFLEDYVECDFDYGNCIITCRSLKGYFYRHKLYFKSFSREI